MSDSRSLCLTVDQKTTSSKRVLPCVLEGGTLHREAKKNLSRQASVGFPGLCVSFRLDPFCAVTFNTVVCASVVLMQWSLENPRGQGSGGSGELNLWWFLKGGLPGRAWQCRGCFPTPCPMHLFIWILYNIFYNKWCFSEFSKLLKQTNQT